MILSVELANNDLVHCQEPQNVILFKFHSKKKLNTYQ